MKRAAHYVRLRVDAQVEARDDPKEPRTRPTRRPIEVLVLRVAGVDDVAIRGDDVETEHAHARRPQHPAVPAEATLQQITAKPHAAAVAGRKKQSAPAQSCGQLVMKSSRTSRRA